MIFLTGPVCSKAFGNARIAGDAYLPAGHALSDTLSSVDSAGKKPMDAFPDRPGVYPDDEGAGSAGAGSKHGPMQVSLLGGITNASLDDYKLETGTTGTCSALSYGIEADRRLGAGWALGLRLDGFLVAFNQPSERDVLAARRIESPSMDLHALQLGVSYEGEDSSGIHVRAFVFAGPALASFTCVQKSTVVRGSAGYQEVANRNNVPLTCQGTTIGLSEGGELILPLGAGFEFFMELSYRLAYFRQLKATANKDYDGDGIADVPQGSVYRSSRLFDAASTPAVVFDFSGFRGNLGFRFKQ